jgi:hypothetical protein
LINKIVYQAYLCLKTDILNIYLIFLLLFFPANNPAKESIKIAGILSIFKNTFIDLE